MVREGFRRYKSPFLPGFNKTQRLTDVDSTKQYTKGQTCSMPDPGIVFHDIEPLIALK
jgi:hypothetical protein